MFRLPLHLNETEGELFEHWRLYGCAIATCALATYSTFGSFLGLTTNLGRLRIHQRFFRETTAVLWQAPSGKHKQQKTMEHQ